MKNWQFIVILILNLAFIWAWVYAFINLSDKIDSIEIPQIQETKNDGNYHMDEKEFNRILTTIEEDAHFCRLWIQSHSERWEKRSQDFTKLYLSNNL